MKRDMMYFESGGIATSEPTSKRLLIRHFNLSPVIGIGYWADVYDGRLGFKGVTRNFILPFVRIQWGYLEPSI